MKTIFSLFLLTVSLSAARAQDAAPTPTQTVDSQIPAVVYQVPVVYAAPVVYQAPVTYNAPVYFVTPAGNPAPCTPACAPPCAPACAAPEPIRSTVVYIGGGHVRYQESACNSGSTVTYIGGGSRFH